MGKKELEKKIERIGRMKGKENKTERTRER